MNITVIVDDTTHSGQNYQIINEMNKWSNEQVQLIALNNSSRVTHINVPVLNPSEVHHQTGLVIATSIPSFEFLNKTFAKCSKMYYMWDLGYIYTQFSFTRMSQLLKNVIVPSVDYAEVVGNLGKATVCPFDLEKLWNLQINTKQK